jgi:predicted CXXCH cytochrome family protein
MYNKKCCVKNIAYSLIAITIISSCVTKRNYKSLSFFFDGVPDPSVKEKVEISHIDSSAQTVEIDSSITKPIVFKHFPYAENDCNSCHDKKFLGAYVEPLPALCYQCHENFNESYNSLHGPVKGGYCTSCHDPHQSKISALLLEEGQQLCFRCHETSVISPGNFHSDIGEKSCIDCHNPHGGGNNNYLVEGSCLNCHDNFNQKYDYLHGPVALGYCNTCHDSHNSGKENLLLRAGQKLCTSCHDIITVLQNEIHDDIDNLSCLECHNAHGGEDRFILN